MKIVSRLAAALAAGALVLPAAALAAKATSDLVPPQKRQATVDLAARLAKRTPPEPLPADLASPFNPAGFDKPDPAAAGARGASAPTVASNAPAQPSGPTNDRETLEMLAAQIKPSGTILLRGAPRLIINNKPFEIGTRFTATYNNEDYDLELVAIDRTTFTLRYRGEEVTRPIQRVR